MREVRRLEALCTTGMLNGPILFLKDDRLTGAGWN